MARGPHYVAQPHHVHEQAVVDNPGGPLNGGDEYGGQVAQAAAPMAAAAFGRGASCIAPAGMPPRFESVQGARGEPLRSDVPAGVAHPAYSWPGNWPETEALAQGARVPSAALRQSFGVGERLPRGETSPPFRARGHSHDPEGAYEVTGGAEDRPRRESLLTKSRDFPKFDGKRGQANPWIYQMECYA